MIPKTEDSPCVHVCLMNYETDHCMGCFRTLAEIAGWTGYTPARKHEIQAALESRRTALQIPE